MLVVTTRTPRTSTPRSQPLGKEGNSPLTPRPPEWACLGSWGAVILAAPVILTEGAASQTLGHRPPLLQTLAVAPSSMNATVPAVTEQRWLRCRDKCPHLVPEETWVESVAGPRPCQRPCSRPVPLSSLDSVLLSLSSNSGKSPPGPLNAPSVCIHSSTPNTQGHTDKTCTNH